MGTTKTTVTASAAYVPARRIPLKLAWYVQLFAVCLFGFGAIFTVLSLVYGSEEPIGPPLSMAMIGATWAVSNYMTLFGRAFSGETRAEG